MQAFLFMLSYLRYSHSLCSAAIKLLATVTELQGQAEGLILCVTYVCSLQVMQLFYPFKTEIASVEGWGLCLCVLKAAREKEKKKVQKQQHLCTCEQEQRNCQVLPFLLMSQFKIHLLEQHLSIWPSALLPNGQFLLF